MARPFTLLTLAVTLLPLCGCIRYEEHINLDASGKGSVEITLQRPEQSSADARLVAQFDARFCEAQMRKNLPGDVSFVYFRSVHDNLVEVSMKYQFNNLSALVNWAATSGSPLGNISLVNKNDSVEYTRHFAADKDAFENAHASTPEGRASFKFTGPGEIKTNNATRTDGRTATWEFKAPELFENNGKTLAAEYSTGNSDWIYPAIALILLGAGAVFWLRRRQRPAKPA